MIKEIKALLEKYNRIRQNSEYVSVIEVINDLYRLQQDARLKRLPKDER